MENDNDFEKLLISMIESNRSLDMAESEFKRQIGEDMELKDEYKAWCEEKGYSVRYGFKDFAAEYLENRESIWDSLTDYNEDE